MNDKVDTVFGIDADVRGIELKDRLGMIGITGQHHRAIRTDKQKRIAVASERLFIEAIRIHKIQGCI